MGTTRAFTVSEAGLFARDGRISWYLAGQQLFHVVQSKRYPEINKTNIESPLILLIFQKKKTAGNLEKHFLIK